MRVRLTDIRDHSVRELELKPESRTMTGWQPGALGWAIGGKGSGAPIEFDEFPDDCTLGVFVVTYMVLLWGTAENLDVWLFPQVPQNKVTKLVPIEPERWLLIEKEELGRVAMGGGNVRVRIDMSPIRFGNYILESLYVPEVAKETCAFCSEPLQTYFRVGSQPACPACTEKFKQEMRTNLSKNYWRALGVGVGAAVVGGAIHAALLSFASISFGSILTALLVAISMRAASRESAGVRHRITAVVLTLAAGSMQWWLGRETTAGSVYLAFGLFSAWMISARNVRTEISGPFQAK